MSVSTGARMGALASFLLVGACLGNQDSASKIEVGNGNDNPTDTSAGGGGGGGGGGGTGGGTININTQFKTINLLSDQPNVAPHQDAAMKDDWGLSSTQNLFWMDAQGSDQVVVADSTGQALPDKIMLDTGITGNAVSELGQIQMDVDNTCAPVKLVVASETGKLFGVNTDLSKTKGAMLIDRSTVGAQYTGVAIAQKTAQKGGQAQELVLAADFANGRIDVFNVRGGNLQLFTGLTFDISTIPNLPRDFSPFNIMVSGDKVFVTLAQKGQPSKGQQIVEPVPGAGKGVVAAFGLDGKLLWSTPSDLFNEPWGMALGNFVLCARGALIIGNHGTGRTDGQCKHGDDGTGDGGGCGANPNQNGGTLTVLDPLTGKVVGQLMDKSNKPVMIAGLWGIAFSTGTNDTHPDGLFFCAGPDEVHGLFGVIVTADDP